MRPVLYNVKCLTLDIHISKLRHVCLSFAALHIYYYIVVGMNRRRNVTQFLFTIECLFLQSILTLKFKNNASGSSQYLVFSWGVKKKWYSLNNIIISIISLWMTYHPTLQVWLLLMILMWEEEVACTVVERLPLVLKTSGATYKPSIIMPTEIHNAYWNMKFVILNSLFFVI